MTTVTTHISHNIQWFAVLCAPQYTPDIRTCTVDQCDNDQNKFTFSRSDRQTSLCAIICAIHCHSLSKTFCVFQPANANRTQHGQQRPMNAHAPHTYYTCDNNTYRRLKANADGFVHRMTRDGVWF